MSWLSKATGIHWGNIGPVAGAIIGSIIPGVGTALGSAIGGGLGGLANHKNNTIGNIINMGAGIASAIPSVAGAAQGFLGGSAPGVAGAGGAASGGISGAIKGGLSKLGNIFGGGGAVGNAASSAAGGSGGILDSIGGLIKDSSGNLDWQKIANLGLGAMDTYNAAQSGQKANSLLNKGIGQYNDNWNQGKDLVLHPPPINFVSQASNPFAPQGASGGIGDPNALALQQYLASKPASPLTAPLTSHP